MRRRNPCWVLPVFEEGSTALASGNLQKSSAERWDARAWRTASARMMWSRLTPASVAGWPPARYAPPASRPDVLPLPPARARMTEGCTGSLRLYMGRFVWVRNVRSGRSSAPRGPRSWWLGGRASHCFAPEAPEPSALCDLAGRIVGPSSALLPATHSGTAHRRRDRFRPCWPHRPHRTRALPQGSTPAGWSRQTHLARLRWRIGNSARRRRPGPRCSSRWTWSVPRRSGTGCCSSRLIW